MRMERYSYDGRRTPKAGRRFKWLYVGLSVVAVLVLGFVAYKLLAPKSVEKAVSQLQFDGSVTEAEKHVITSAVQTQQKTYDGTLRVSVKTGLEHDNAAHVLAAYVPVTSVYAGKQSVTKTELATASLSVPADMDEATRSALADTIGTDVSKLAGLSGELTELTEAQIAFVPADQLTRDVKLLKLDGMYYLDDFTKGAVYRQAIFSGEPAATAQMSDLSLNELPNKEEVLKVNMSGVTALTRLLQRKLSTVKDPLYFSEKIGDFMADADITHISNEVSFRAGCQYHNALFCSPPEFIETLKDSGVDLVELTGNHNNDNGSTYNTDSINLYHSVGMKTYGGGLNADEARKPYLADMKGSKVAFLAYNMADGSGSGAIAGATTAGANLYTEEKARADIEAAKQSSQFVIVNIQYAECQAYPAGYVEFPQCDGPISGQQEDFRALIDMGADMVVGSSAHQPQTYELYEGKPIYYGLGNMYFEQVQWPGTERGIILTHYFKDGKLLQTKLTPTVYDRDFQTMVMGEAEAVILLDRLGQSRP